MQYNMLEAKKQLSKLVQAALAGEDVVIARNGIPVVRLEKKINMPDAMRKPGEWADLPKAGVDWDSPDTNLKMADALGALRSAQ